MSTNSILLIWLFKFILKSINQLAKYANKNLKLTVSPFCILKLPPLTRLCTDDLQLATWLPRLPQQRCRAKDHYLVGAEHHDLSASFVLSHTWVYALLHEERAEQDGPSLPHPQYGHHHCWVGGAGLGVPGQNTFHGLGIVSGCGLCVVGWELGLRWRYIPYNVCTVETLTNDCWIMLPGKGVPPPLVSRFIFDIFHRGVHACCKTGEIVMYSTL